MRRHQFINWRPSVSSAGPFYMFTNVEMAFINVELAWFFNSITNTDFTGYCLLIRISHQGWINWASLPFWAACFGGVASDPAFLGSFRGLLCRFFRRFSNFRCFRRVMRWVILGFKWLLLVFLCFIIFHRFKIKFIMIKEILICIDN